MRAAIRLGLFNLKLYPTSNAAATTTVASADIFSKCPLKLRHCVFPLGPC